MLEIQNLSYRYRTGANVLDGVSFSLSKGETLCLLGPNGTGKTTLLKCLLGFVRPKSGAILLDGINTSRISHKARAKLLAYVPQSTALAFPYEAREVVLMGRVAHLAPGTSHSAEDKQIAMDMLKILGIEHLAARRFQELSGGERQMIIVARALAQRADYLVMDEPTANLDYSNQVKILKIIRALSEQGYGILMTSHCPDHAFLACGKAVLLRGGRVQSEGTPDSTVTSQSLSELYQTSICVSQTVAEGREVKVCVPVLD